ncbi:conserved exported hypothetical protein [Nostocoides australiense Ben110]|uniref:Uncharacterized protein n=1 Tax=Nostocoides australiense Ben110 TaxID=1193182 RepID=W6JXK7_9MICO|nr:conserved exported hypothetical protein [Tetrasphaera australiensis Ben110]
MTQLRHARLGPPLAIAALLAAGGVITTPATAATCSSTDGVSVVVDSGNGIQTGCAPGDPASAWAALESAGFRLEGTQRFPASFICRINGYPAPADEPCVQTPPTRAYWALWSAAAGGGWTYSSTGAASLNPAPGSSVGVAFGAGRQPGMAPPVVSPPSTTAPATTSTTRAPTSSGTTSAHSETAGAQHTSAADPGSSTPGSSTPGSSTGAAGPAGTRATSSASATTSQPSTSATSTSGSRSTSSSSSATVPTVTATTEPPSAAASPRAGESPSPALIVAGGAGLGLLLVLGAFVVRRQRDRAAAL